MSDVWADERITLTGLLLESAAALARELDSSLRREHGIPLATYEVLVRLARSPGNRMSLTELGRQLSLTTGGVTRLVDRLEGAGLLRREPDSTDRRRIDAALSPAGRQVVAAATATHLADVQRALVDPLGADAADVAAGLRRLRDSLTGDPAARLAR